MNIDFKQFKVPAILGLLAITLIGVAMRFYAITDNRFIYYDEGLYLNQSLDFLKFVQENPPHSFQELSKQLTILGHLSLSNAKALWFYVCGLRVYFVGADGWFFPRIISAIFGSLTLVVVYLIARRYFDSIWIGLVSMAVLAIHPSHLYYSRLGMQEALSTFCFITAFYFYLHTRLLSWRTVVSGILFACVYFTNYRMIVIPLLLLVGEIFFSICHTQSVSFRKYLWTSLIFLLLVFGIGALDDGANTRICFSWIYYQSHLAQGDFGWINLWAFPYYIFQLEGFWFGLLFFSSIFFLFVKQPEWALPFVVAIVEMLLFSFSQEKGVRYSCVVMPFMAMAVGAVIVYLFLVFQRRETYRQGLLVVVGLMALTQLFKDFQIVGFKTDYETAINDIRADHPDAKFLSTQPLLQKIFTPGNTDVLPVPDDWKSFLILYGRGYKYLIVDPQAYISYTEDGDRFSPPLQKHLEAVLELVPPLKEYDHFSHKLLERFVLEHNVNLDKSLSFIRSADEKGYGKLRVYDIKESLIYIRQQIRKASNE